MKIIKSFRKTITLKVDNDGEIIVKAPYFTSEKKILEFVGKHSSWVEKRKLDILWSKKNFKEGEMFFYLGQEYPLQFDDKSKKLNFDGEVFWLLKTNETSVKDKFLEFYKLEAKDYIQSRLKYISKKNNLEYKDIRITRAKTRWGSCSSKKNLSFSFRLIMTPRECIDYVIIHELAHLKQMNHSKKFWDLVDIMARGLGVDYKLWRKWLKTNGKKLDYL